MIVTFLGHACVKLEHDGRSLIIDPYLTGNPLAAASADDIQVDHILLTHGHGDHVGDTVSIAKRTGAQVVGTPELAAFLGWQGVANTVGMNIGGTYDLGYAKVKMVQAFHSSGYTLSDEQRIVYLGMPTGLIVTWGGHTLLHAGDTGLFGDMKMIGDRHEIDLAFIPIGDHFTMGPEDALTAAEWLKPKQVVPVHYDTFPPLRQDAAAYARALEQKGIKGTVLKPGDRLEL
ncbi:L-ascorbate metabolism protein UlaG, beta-lactamase superfamily [Cohnella sp. OV330]|uniref:metal-dependent hydrolase n=1 Tax=Cohnella sp. OV330 TaxID=1855288 RepID=UPI0008E582AB|nr:metal-dependent hydrolase [Cohnella sp. OV330]SFB44030.1 L-ascorbate metabolism protein UlaG, beta-lactamase superfamily [Cohnella sp. OV330]